MTSHPPPPEANLYTYNEEGGELPCAPGTCPNAPKIPALPTEDARAIAAVAPVGGSPVCNDPRFSCLMPGPSEPIEPSNIELNWIRERAERHKPTAIREDEGNRALYNAGKAAAEEELRHLTQQRDDAEQQLHSAVEACNAQAAAIAVLRRELAEAREERDAARRTVRQHWAAYCGADAQMCAAQERERVAHDHRARAERERIGAEQERDAALARVAEWEPTMVLVRRWRECDENGGCVPGLADDPHGDALADAYDAIPVERRPDAPASPIAPHPLEELERRLRVEEKESDDD